MIYTDIPVIYIYIYRYLCKDIYIYVHMHIVAWYGPHLAIQVMCQTANRNVVLSVSLLRTGVPDLDTFGKLNLEPTVISRFLLVVSDRPHLY